MGKLQSLEVLRAVAAMLVVLFHVQAIMTAKFGVVPFGGAFGAGSRGVDLFFVLSGFIITTVHRPDWGRPAGLRVYLWNRLTRIYPAVFVMSAFAVATYAAGFHGVGHGGKLRAWEIVSGFLLLPQAGEALVNVTWTLKYEMAFYLLFACAIVNRRLGLAVLCGWQGVILAMILSGAALPAGWIGFYLRPICLEFGIGMVCALLVARPPTQWLSAVVMCAGLILFVGSLAVDTRRAVPFGGSSAVLLFGGGAGMIVGGLALLDRGRLHAPPWMTYLGAASYSIYLVHFSAISLIAAVIAHGNRAWIGNGVCAGVTIAAVLTGIAFYEAFDRPSQNWLRAVRPPYPSH